MDESGASHTVVMGSYARAMGPGIKAHMNVIWNETSNGASGDAEMINTGTALVSGIKVVF